MKFENDHQHTLDISYKQLTSQINNMLAIRCMIPRVKTILIIKPEREPTNWIAIAEIPES